MYYSIMEIKLHYFLRFFLFLAFFKIPEIQGACADGSFTIGAATPYSLQQVGYDDHEYCVWIFSTDDGGFIKIQFNSFDTESCCDYLFIGTSTDTDKYGTFSGPSTPSDVCVMDTSVHVIFDSDFSFTKDGFDMTVSSVAATCGPGTSSPSGFDDTMTPGGSCVDCEVDKYQPNSRSTMCIDCDPNTGTLGTGGTASTQCLAICGPGTSSPSGLDDTMTPAGSCVDCEVDKYQPNSRSTMCIDCDPNTGTLGTGGTASTQCLAICGPGTSSPSSLDDTDTPGGSCVDCDVDKYQPNSRSTMCIDCDPNTGTSGTGSTECFAMCGPGTSSPSGLDDTITPGGSCGDCDVDKYQPNSRSTMCIDCDPNTGTSGTGRTASTECLAHCPPGYFSSTGLLPCRPCGIDYYQPLQRQTSCEICSFGTGTREVGSVGCTDICRAGTHSSTGFAPCASCPKDYYQHLSRRTSCEQCPPGTGTVEEAADVIDLCIDHCDVGESSPTGLSPCFPCEPGSAQPNQGSTSCDICPMGSYQPNFQSDSCIPCESGFFQPSTGSDSCLRCPKDFYQASSGSAECESCPSETATAGEGSIRLADCLGCLFLDEIIQQDNDNDGTGDNCDEDDDNDGFADEEDLCPFMTDSVQIDTDQDGIGDICDNCDGVANANQTDEDGDDIGDACDNCIGLFNPYQANFDGDVYGDACDPCYGSPDDPDMPDMDNDGIWGGCDNCPNDSNRNQEDTDLDGRGNPCDNCPLVPNFPQQDLNNNGIGDLCETEELAGSGCDPNSDSNCDDQTVASVEEATSSSSSILMWTILGTTAGIVVILTLFGALVYASNFATPLAIPSDQGSAIPGAIFRNGDVFFADRAGNIIPLRRY